MQPDIFDDIRPYRDEEIPAAVKRIAESEILPAIAEFVYPGEEVQAVARRIAAVKSSEELLHTLAKDAVKRVLDSSTTQFTVSGFDKLDPRQPYLFVSNHRDIVLDAAILQYVLDQYGHSTCYITFGANLMSNPLITDLGKSMKMFRTERGGNKMDFYRNMMHLSAYMRHLVTEENASIWIAQRNGRTKNGIDATDPAVMKMFSLSGSRDLASSMAALHIVPVAISYEWETCDIAKAVETYMTRQNGSYVKVPGEDLQSIINGIVAPKGQVHLEVCKPLEIDDLEPLSKSKTEFFPQVAALMDKRINAAFRLMPTHYIAHDLRSGTRQYAAFYDDEKEQQFHLHLGKVTAFSDCDTELLRSILLDLYANAVDQKIKP